MRCPAHAHGRAPPLALLALGGTWPAVAADVPVRFGTHPTFERMVFDWRDAVDYRVDHKGSSAVISFDRAAEIDRQGLADGLAPAVLTRRYRE